MFETAQHISRLIDNLTGARAFGTAVMPSLNGRQNCRREHPPCLLRSRNKLGKTALVGVAWFFLPQKKFGAFNFCWGFLKVEKITHIVVVVVVVFYWRIAKCNCRESFGRVLQVYGNGKFHNSNAYKCSLFALGFERLLGTFSRFVFK